MSDFESHVSKEDNSELNHASTADSGVVSLISNNVSDHSKTTEVEGDTRDDSGLKENKESLNSLPIDRGWAWVIVGACFGMHILVPGAIKSFGVLFVEFRDKYDASSRDLGMIQGITRTLMLGLGLAANVLAVKFTSQKVVFAGGILSALGFALSSVIPSFEFLYLTYSLIAGLGFALSYSPCVVMVGHHFKKRRSLANGISVSGSGVGSFILPNIMRWMLKEYGLSGCLLVMGGLMLNVCVCAMLLRPISSYTNKPPEKTCQPVLEGKDSDYRNLMIEVKKEKSVSELYDLNSKFKDHNGNKDAQDELLREIKTDSQTTELQRLFSSNEDITIASLQSIPPEKMQNMASGLFTRFKCSHSKKTQAPGSTGGPKLFNWSLLSNPVFLIYASSCAMANFAIPNIFLMLPAFAESNGQNRDNAAFLLSIIGITDLAGRLFFGWFSDLKFFPTRYAFIGGMALSGVAVLVAPVLTTFAGMATFAAVYGFFAGSFFALISVMLAEGLGVEKLSSSYGLATLAMSVGLLPGPLICGEIQDATSKWDYAFILCGIVTLLGSVPPFFEPYAKRYVEAKETRKVRHTKNGQNV